MKWSFKKVTAMIAILVVLAGGIFLAAYLKEVADYKRSVREIAIEEICLSDIPDGEYIGECNVDFIYAKVEVTVHSGQISNIRILEHKNERGQAAEVIIDKIVSEQRIDVDAVWRLNYCSVSYEILTDCLCCFQIEHLDRRVLCDVIVIV